ncbi:MAG: carbonic anhydrase family protein [Thiotrichales bacterium]|nr:carbonic anhydrase family protein [Thiotrichales bacterium]
MRFASKRIQQVACHAARFGVLIFGGLALTGAPVYAQEPPLIDLGAELEQLQQKPASPSGQAVQNPAPPEPASPEKLSKPAKAATKPVETPPPDWGYQGQNGPQAWGRLAPEFSLCATGKNQSPIDLRDARAIGTQGLPSLDIFYRDVPLKLQHTGKGVQVNYPIGSGFIQVAGQRYELMSLALHTPSEHYKEGFSYPLEVQIEHRNGDGQRVMIAVIFQEGAFNPQLDVLLGPLPKTAGKELFFRGLSLNPVQFLPGNTEFYQYNGSLTQPPCSEGVYWMVFKQPLEASAEQIQRLTEVLGDNARPPQALNARHLLKSWSELPLENRPYEFY